LPNSFQPPCVAQAARHGGSQERRPRDDETFRAGGLFHAFCLSVRVACVLLQMILLKANDIGGINVIAILDAFVTSAVMSRWLHRRLERVRRARSGPRRFRAAARAFPPTHGQGERCPPGDAPRDR